MQRESFEWRRFLKNASVLNRNTKRISLREEKCTNIKSYWIIIQREYSRVTKILEESIALNCSQSEYPWVRNIFQESIRWRWGRSGRLRTTASPIPQEAQCRNIFVQDIEMRWMSKLWSKTRINFKARCGWSSSLKQSSGVLMCRMSCAELTSHLCWHYHHQWCSIHHGQSRRCDFVRFIWHVCHLWSWHLVVSLFRFIAPLYTLESPTAFSSNHISWSHRCLVIHTCWWILVHLAWHHDFLLLRFLVP